MLNNINIIKYKYYMNISKTTIKRLAKDVGELMNEPLINDGIYYVHDEDNVLTGYALIIGPKDTPYEYGYYFFKLQFPENYPSLPPKVIFCTNDGRTRFNPNLYRNGKCCVSILNTWSGEQWTSCLTIKSVLLTISTLLCNNPLLNEPGIKITHPQVNIYTEIIKFKNIQLAIFDIMNQKIKIPFYNSFKQIVENKFIENKENILNNINKGIKLYPLNSVDSNLYCSIYEMRCYIDYLKLKNDYF